MLSKLNHVRERFTIAFGSTDMLWRNTGSSQPGRALVEPLTAAEHRVLQLLPTSTYVQIAATLYVSRNTVKTHLHSIYLKLGVTSRAQAIERAADLRIL